MKKTIVKMLTAILRWTGTVSVSGPEPDTQWQAHVKRNPSQNK